MRLARTGSEFAKITRFAGCWISSMALKVEAVGEAVMADKSSDESEANQTTVPGSDRLTTAVITRFSPTLILLAAAKELVIVTMGDDDDATITVVEAALDRPVFETSTLKVDVVLAVCAEEYSDNMGFLIADANKVKLQLWL